MISLIEMVEGIGKATGVEPILNREPMQPGDVLITYADVALAKAELGYQPSTTLAEGLERFVLWYRNELERAVVSRAR